MTDSVEAIVWIKRELDKDIHIPIMESVNS